MRILLARTIDCHGVFVSGATKQGYIVDMKWIVAGGHILWHRMCVCVL